MRSQIIAVIAVLFCTAECLAGPIPEWLISVGGKNLSSGKEIKAASYNFKKKGGEIYLPRSDWECNVSDLTDRTIKGNLVYKEREITCTKKKTGDMVSISCSCYSDLSRAANMIQTNSMTIVDEKKNAFVIQIMCGKLS